MFWCYWQPYNHICFRFELCVHSCHMHESMSSFPSLSLNNGIWNLCFGCDLILSLFSSVYNIIAWKRQLEGFDNQKDEKGQVEKQKVDLLCRHKTKQFSLRNTDGLSCDNICWYVWSDYFDGSLFLSQK